MSADIRRILNNEEELINISKPIFQAVDVDNSGYIDEKELYQMMCNTASEFQIANPTLEEVQTTMVSLDRNRDGKISLDEYIELVKGLLREMLKGETDAHDNGNEKKAEEQINKQLQMFEKYLEESGITMAFQLIFAEILTKKIEPNNVFTYTAMRLRQIGKEIAHLLPKNLTANISEST